MDKLFLTVLNMSLTGAFVIAAICIIRLPLKKAPKSISYYLWAVAGFRLIFPFSIESIISLIPFKAQTIPSDIATQPVPRIDSGITAIDNLVSSSLPAPSQEENINPLQTWISIGSIIWIIGIFIMLAYSLISYSMLRRKMRNAVCLKANIYESENIKSPFVLCIFSPKIFLPINLSPNEREYIILHEQTHIRRRDYIVKLAAYFILSLHWFNPLVWVAYVLMESDMEMSCDECVLKKLGSGIKKDYSLSLLSFASEDRIIGGSPLAFGERSVKERIKNVLNFKKSSRKFVIVTVALVALLSVGLTVNGIQVSHPWINIRQKTDWPVKDMTYDRITFGSDREQIVYRLGSEPDAETVSPDGSSILSYYLSPAQYIAPGETEAVDVPDSDTYVTFYLDNPECIEKKGLTGVWRIDVVGDCEMTGRSDESDGTLSGVLAQYGGPNDVEIDGDKYILWYYSPDDYNMRMWFEVKDNELTKHMGISYIK